jgi:hypothetical protein
VRIEYTDVERATILSIDSVKGEIDDALLGPREVAELIAMA